MKPINELVVDVATSNLGYGESTSNNEGPFLTAISAPPQAEWCAYFSNYCLRRAHELYYDYARGRILPALVPFCYRKPGVLEGSAKALTRGVGAFGSLFSEPERARPGDLVCWSRGTLGWHGHVGVVTDVDEHGIVGTIEGNTGRFPSKVRRFTHDVSKERLYYFASLRQIP